MRDLETVAELRSVNDFCGREPDEIADEVKACGAIALGMDTPADYEDVMETLLSIPHIMGIQVVVTYSQQPPYSRAILFPAGQREEV